MVTPSIKVYNQPTASWTYVASGVTGGTGGGGGGGLSLADADAVFLKPDEVHAGSGINISNPGTGVITISSVSLAGLPVSYAAPNKTSTAITLQGATGVVFTDADQMSVFDGKAGTRGLKTFWLNERGCPRCRSADDNEPAMRIDQASATQAANLLEINDYTNSVQLAMFGPTGTLTLNRGLRVTTGTLGAGRVLTSDATGNATWQAPGGGGGLQTRASVAKTTASLAANASETGTITMAAGWRLYKVTCSAAARVRLYATTAQRDADVSRAMGALPGGNHGLEFEFVAGTGLLAMDVTPAVDGHDAKTTPDGAIPITITNLGTVAAAVTVTLIWLRTE